MGAGKEWCGFECFLACKAFIRASEGPISVNGRNFCDFALPVLGEHVRLTCDNEEGGIICAGEAPML